MRIGICHVELHLPGNGSLKQKRSQLKSILSRLHKEFNLATAEVGQQDMWQSAVIGLVTVSNDGGQVHSVLERAVHWIESHRPDVQVIDWGIEVL